MRTTNNPENQESWLQEKIDYLFFLLFALIARDEEDEASPIQVHIAEKGLLFNLFFRAVGFG